MLPIVCHGCGHRFQRTASVLLEQDGLCPRCASSDIDLDEKGLPIDAREAKVQAIAETVWESNPQLDRKTAVSIARETVSAYPGVVRD